MKNIILLLTKLSTYLKMIMVCFINNLVDKHILDVLNESRSLSKVNMSRSNNTSQADSFHSEKRDFSFPILDVEKEDVRSRSLPHIIGDPLVSDVKVSPSGPAFPAILEQTELPSNEVVETYKKKKFLFRRFNFKKFIVNNNRISASMKIFIYTILAFIITVLLRLSYIHTSLKNCIPTFTSSTRTSAFNDLSKLDIIRFLISSKSSPLLEKIHFTCSIDHMHRDRLNVVVIPAILTMIDYTVCSNYLTSSKFLKNLTLLEVYHNLNSLDHNLKLKMVVWLTANLAFVMNLKFNKFVLRTINGLESYDIFRLFQVTLNNNLVYFRLIIFYSLYRIIPLGTLLPLIVLMKMMMALTQIMNLRFVQQEDPYNLFKISMTCLVWLVSCVAFGQAKNYKALLSKKANMIYIFKRLCVLMACKYYAILVFDYKLTLIPLSAYMHENRLNILKKPLFLFKPMILSLLTADVDLKSLKTNLSNFYRAGSLSFSKERIIAKCLYVETVENIRTSSRDDLGLDEVIDDFATVVYLTNKRLVKWTNNGYTQINNDSFQKLSWDFFINKFYGRSLEIDELIDFKDNNFIDGSTALDKIPSISALEGKGIEMDKLIVSGDKSKFCLVYPTSEEENTVNLLLMDVSSKSFKTITIDEYCIDDVVDCYYFQEGPLGVDSANSILVVTRSAEIIEVDLYSFRKTIRKLNLLTRIDHWERLKTDRMAERSIIHDTKRKYIGQYVRFKGWKILPFPVEFNSNDTMKNVMMKKGNSMNIINNKSGGGSIMMSKFKMFPMVHQASDPLSSRSSNKVNNKDCDVILKVNALEHLGFIYEIIENETEYKNKLIIRLLDCITGKNIKQFEISKKNVEVDTIRIAHEKDLKFCGFCGFLSCKKLHLHYMVKNPNTKEISLNIVVLINGRVKNMKKQRICFRTERDSRDIRCHGIQEMSEVIKKIKIPEKNVDLIYNRYEDSYVFFSKRDKGKFFKINLDLFKVSSIPYTFESHEFSKNQVIGFDNFKYNIPKAIADEEIRRKDLKELENDREDLMYEEDGIKKRRLIKDENKRLRYLYDLKENRIYYY
ncbi:uncharacterized protein HGUI_01108 [Hanseniaspora guilliermondii]|uniref:Uncharacterized protein n=1 Tax=Hanseniaspora guilliermondii TaxID=56406 RepID=A0A1L0AZE4_9ASCO|nr:uncharacterized protein HGUI_01108 [Hanseniaspora guilliermondii]